MRQMKDSGIAWIGEMPADWRTGEIKVYCKYVYAGGTPRSDVLEYWNGTIPWLPSGCCHNCRVDSADKFITEEGLNNSSTKMIPADTALLAMTGATCGNTAYLMIDACVNQSVTAYVAKETTYSLYIWYLLQAAKENLLTFQTGGAQGGVNVEDCKNIIVPIIGFDEQKRRADYLDSKCSQIDSIISKQEAVIEKLKEYKLSVITEAVTKGLDSSVEMKDSGIEWMGNIPINWTVHKLCWDYSAMLGKMLDAKSIVGTHLHPYIKNSDVQWFDINFDNLSEMDFDDEELERYSVCPGDLMVCEGGEIGKCAIVPDDAPQGVYYQKALHRIRRREGSVGSSRFLSYVLFCMAHNQCFGTSPEKATIAHLPGDALAQLRIPSPLGEEQIQIADYLDNKCSQINSMIDLHSNTKDSLLMFKKSLIYEVVTGKKEV